MKNYCFMECKYSVEKTVMGKNGLSTDNIHIADCSPPCSSMHEQLTPFPAMCRFSFAAVPGKETRYCLFPASCFRASTESHKTCKIQRCSREMHSCVVLFPALNSAVLKTIG